MTDVTPCELIKVCGVSGGDQRRAKRRKPIRCGHPSALLCGLRLAAPGPCWFRADCRGRAVARCGVLGRASVQVTATCVDGYVDRWVRRRRADFNESPDRGFNG